VGHYKRKLASPLLEESKRERKEGLIVVICLDAKLLLGLHIFYLMSLAYRYMLVMAPGSHECSCDPSRWSCCCCCCCLFCRCTLWPQRRDPRQGQPRQG
jgi:hypothetical protein